MIDILMIRHAEPAGHGCYLGRRSDPGLSRNGAMQARELAGLLARERPDSLYSSPLRRAVETLLPLSKDTGENIRIVEGLSEIDFGEWEGLTWNEIESEDPLALRSWYDDPWTVAPPGGETLRQFSDRVIPAFEGIFLREGQRKIVIACHGGLLRVILGLALGLPPDRFWAARTDYAALSRFVRERNGQMNLAQWNVPTVSPEAAAQPPDVG